MTDDDLKALFAALQRENAATREENAAAHAETRRHFEVLAEGTRHEIRLVAEAGGELRGERVCPMRNIERLE